MTELIGMEKATYTVQLKDSRKRLFTVLDGIIGFAEEKRLLKGNNDKAKQAWSRIAIAGIQAYGTLLKDSDLDEINLRLERLESQQSNIGR